MDLTQTDLHTILRKKYVAAMNVENTWKSEKNRTLQAK